MTRKPKALRPGSDCWVREESAFAPLALHNVRVRGDSEAPLVVDLGHNLHEDQQ